MATGFSRICAEFDTVGKHSVFQGCDKLMTPFLISVSGELHWMSVGNDRIIDLRANTSIWIDSREAPEATSNPTILPSTSSRRFKIRQCAKFYSDLIPGLVTRWEQLLDAED